MPCARAARSWASTPSVTNAPTFRPAKLFGAIFHDAQRVGDGFRSLRVGRAAVAGLGISFSRRPSATVFAEILVDVEQVRDHARADRRGLNLAQLEGQGVGDVVLFGLGLADVELPGLAVVIGERLRTGRGSWWRRAARGT